MLILTPASLRLQWRDEMWDKFSLSFDLVDREETHALRRRLGMDLGRVSRLWAEVAGRPARSLTPLGTVRHAVVDRRYEVEVFRVEEGPASRGGSRRSRSGKGARLLTSGELLEEATGGLLRKVLLLEKGELSARREGRGPGRPPGAPRRRNGG